jgi:hypothetical protein
VCRSLFAIEAPASVEEEEENWILDNCLIGASRSLLWKKLIKPLKRSQRLTGCRCLYSHDFHSSEHKIEEKRDIFQN